MMTTARFCFDCRNRITTASYETIVPGLDGRSIALCEGHAQRERERYGTELRALPTPDVVTAVEA